MSTTTTKSARHLLQWVFGRGSELLTCQLSRVGAGGVYVLSLVSPWGEEPVRTERFDSSLAAFQRHAAVAATLREFGWKVVSYTA